MRKLFLMVGIVVVAIACSSAGDMIGEILDSGVPDAGAQPTPAGKFVGYTSEGYRLRPSEPGEGGLFNTYAACQLDFGASARICTVPEILATLNLPAPPPVSDGVSTFDGAWVVATLDQWPSCFGVGSNDSGPILRPDGALQSTDRCGDLRVLACCTVN